LREIDVDRHPARGDPNPAACQILRAIDVHEMHADIAAATIDFLDSGQRLVAVTGAQITACAIDNDSMRAKALPANQLPSVDIQFDANLLGVAGIAAVAAIQQGCAFAGMIDDNATPMAFSHGRMPSHVPSTCSTFGVRGMFS